MSIELKDYAIMLIIFGMVITGSSIVYLDIAANNGLTATDLASLNRTAAINDRLNTIQQSINNTQVTGNSDIDSMIGLFSAGFSTLKFLGFEMVTLLVEMIDYSAIYLKVPSWVTGGLIAIIILSIVYVMAMLMLNRNSGGGGV